MKMNQLWQDKLEEAQTLFYEGRIDRAEFRTRLKALGLCSNRIDNELWAAAEAKLAHKEIRP